MYPLHDKDLDRLSRNAAEHYEMDFGPSGWEQLEKRLDQELPRKKDRRRFLFWLFFIVVTTGGALIGLLINSQPVTPLASRSIKAAPVNQEAVNTLTSDRDQKAANNTPSSQTTVNSNNTTPHQATANNNNTIPNQPTFNNNNTTPNQTTVNNNNTTPFAPSTVGATKPATANRANSVPQHIQRKPFRNNNIEPTLPFGLNNIPRRNHTQTPRNRNKKPVNNNDQSFTPNNDLVATTDNKENTTPQSAAPDKATLTDSTKTPEPVTIAKDAAPKKNNKPNRGFEIGIAGGPDASMVEFGPLYKAGYNIGLQVGYRFNDRWSVNTGIIYTRKFYKADSNTFHAPKHSYISYVKLDKLEGYCAMLDIPLNVRYDFAFNDKRRFFANTGLSTYLMDKQNYDYYYWQTWGAGNYRDSSWASGENSNYLFSVLNLSIGYERMLSRHFSIQAEPYLKIPLKGMGFGKMKMDSYGIYFSLKYRPQFGSKRSANKK